LTLARRGAAPAAGARGGRGAPLAVAAALALLTFLALGRVAGNGFVGMDDEAYITGNAHVAGGLSLPAAAWAFRSTERSNWHPLTWLSHQADASLFGLDPAGHHLVGLALHAANAVLLFAVLRGASGALWRPAAVAALFALHPLHVESVAWAAERKDLLSTLLLLLALGAWLRRARRGGGFPAATAALFAAALLAKPMPVTFPFLLLVLDWWPLGRWAPAGVGPPGAASARFGVLPPAALLREKAALFLLAAASCVVTYRVQEASGAMSGANAIPGAVRAANALVSYVRYLGKAAWPLELAVYYPFSTRIPWWQWAGALLALVAASAWVLRSARRRPWLAAGWLWYLGTLVPAIGLVQVGGQALADRYTYVPLVGIFVGAVWAAGAGARRPGPGARAIPALVAAVVAALGLLSFRQAGYWRDGETLFRHAQAVSPGSWVILNNLGTALATRGRLAEAEEAFRAALRLEPFRAQLHGNLGRALAAQGRRAEAEQAYRRALLIDPRFAQARANLAALLAEPGPGPR
jgi:hypothetical protein